MDNEGDDENFVEGGDDLDSDEDGDDDECTCVGGKIKPPNIDVSCMIGLLGDDDGDEYEDIDEGDSDREDYVPHTGNYAIKPHNARSSFATSMYSMPSMYNSSMKINSSGSARSVASSLVSTPVNGGRFIYASSPYPLYLDCVTFTP